VPVLASGSRASPGPCLPSAMVVRIVNERPVDRHALRVGRPDWRVADTSKPLPLLPDAARPRHLTRPSTRDAPSVADVCCRPGFLRIALLPSGRPECSWRPRRRSRSSGTAAPRLVLQAERECLHAATRTEKAERAGNDNCLPYSSAILSHVFEKIGVFPGCKGCGRAFTLLAHSPVDDQRGHHSATRCSGRRVWTGTRGLGPTPGLQAGSRSAQRSVGDSSPHR